MVAGGGRDLTWPVERVAAHLLQASCGLCVRLLLQLSSWVGPRSPARRNGIAMDARLVRSVIGRCLSVRWSVFRPCRPGQW